MKLHVVAGFAALFLQVNASAQKTLGALQGDLACRFAKSVDMSATSNLCSKSTVVDAQQEGQNRARVSLVSESKLVKDVPDKKFIPSNMSASARPSMSVGKTEAAIFWERISHVEVVLGYGELVGGVLLFGVAATIAAPVVVATAIAFGGGTLIMDGIIRAGTGKGMTGW